MKHLTGVIFTLSFLWACTGINYSPNQLIGKWNNAYEVQYQDSLGNWSDWTQINTLVALPQLEFTSDGRILWDGKTPTTCCLFKNYELKGNKIKLSNPTNSELCNCVNCPSLEIEKLTSEVLELNWCYSKIRYNREK
ncbi:hypothetical protein SAMN06298216_3978 [Spirosomataceae bacterium TFI 002]|nr:hypothetical protein SAMN06298216_3978 [Spirosomataceae bacterium TFI 002]